MCTVEQKISDGGPPPYRAPNVTAKWGFQRFQARAP